MEGQRVRVFRNGRSRAVRIPKALDFEGDEVILRKERNGTLTLTPIRPRMTPKELVAWLRSQPPLDGEWEDIEDLPPDPVDLDFPE